MASRASNQCSSNPDEFCSKELVNFDHQREIARLIIAIDSDSESSEDDCGIREELTSTVNDYDVRNAENGAKSNGKKSTLLYSNVKYSPLASPVVEEDCTKLSYGINPDKDDLQLNQIYNSNTADSLNKDNLSDETTNKLKLQNILNKSSSPLVNEPSTPSASCLKANKKPPCNVRVQFETPDKRNKLNSYVFSNGQTSVKLSGENVSPDLNNRCLSSSTKKSKKKKQRIPSGSSIVSDCSKSSIGTNDSKTAEFERKALDGGWGWVVVFASFMVHCIADGITMSFGILYVELLDTFDESKSLTSWVGSLFMAIPLLAGPLASYATDTYGCRAVTIWGAIISCLGFLLSAYADSILMLLFTIGLIAGLGLAACYVAAIVIVAFYFEKLRSLATGIAVAGSGIGTFVFAPIIQYLLKHYGWSGCMILLAGTLLNMAVCGALMRDLEWKKKKPGKSQPHHNITINSDLGSLMQSSDSIDDAMANNSSTIPSLIELKRLVQTRDIESFMFQDEPIKHIPRSTSLVILPTFMDKSEANATDHFLNLSFKRNNLETMLLSNNFLTKSSNHTDVIPLDKRDLLYQNRKINAFCINHQEDLDITHTSMEENAAADDFSECKESSSKEDVRMKSKQESITTSWVDSSHKYWPVSPFTNRCYRKQSMLYRGAIVDILRYRLRSSSCPNISRSSRTSALEVEKKEALREMISNCTNMSYCMDSSFIIFASSNFILYVFYDTVYMYLTDYAQEIGIPPDDGANLISVIGILNCIGMVLMGYMGDKSWCSPLLIYNGSMVACGLSVIAMPFIDDYYLLATAAAIFGLFISANYALTAVILVQMISLEAFGRSYGVLLLIQGIANLIGPPLVGFLSDATGNYVIPFVVSGIFIIICGLMLSFIPIINNCKSNSIQVDSSPT